MTKARTQIAHGVPPSARPVSNGVVSALTRSRNLGTRSRRTAPVWLLITGLCLAGCASSATQASPAASTPPKLLKATTGVSTGLETERPKADGPGDTAIRYTHDLISGDVTSARALMAPDSVKAFDRISAVSMKSGPGTSRHLVIGSLTRTGKRADVLLTGTVCASTSTTSCITNTSHTPSRANLPFLVHLELDGAQWLVTFPRPTAN